MRVGMGGRARRARALGIGALVALVIALPTTQPATASRVEPVRVSESAPYEQPRGPIAGQDPAGRIIGPGDCAVVPSCHVMALEVAQPAIGPDEDFLVRLTISWDSRPVGESSTNNLDVYVWNDPPGAAPIAQSTVNEPETITLFRPEKPRYEIVVLNRFGPNTGYAVRAELSREALVRPFESVAPGQASRTPARPSSNAAPAAAPGPPSGRGATPTVEATASDVPAPTVTPELAPAPAAMTEPDPQLAALADEPAGLDSLSRPAVTGSAGRGAGRAPAPVSGPAALFWMVLLPLALVGGGGVWLKRQAPAALRA